MLDFGIGVFPGFYSKVQLSSVLCGLRIPGEDLSSGEKLCKFIKKRTFYL